MKIIRLFVDFEFTSLSPDAQPISVGVVSDCGNNGDNVVLEHTESDMLKALDFCGDFGISPDGWEKYSDKLHPGLISVLSNAREDWDKFEAFKRNNAPSEYLIVDFFNYLWQPRSFYAEFTDFDINRCDDWVKENVVRKLKMFDGSDCIGISNENALKMMNSGISCVSGFKYNLQVIGSISEIKSQLISWLSQFSYYEIQVVVDCGTWDWYWFLQLVAEWDEVEVKEFDSFVGTIKLHHVNIPCRIGLPKLPSNISPVPFDLNDLIAIKKGISPKEAFDLNREVLAFMNAGDGVSKNGESFSKHCNKVVEFPSGKILQDGMIKHNSLWDAKVIKAIYNKLMNQ